jgi:hypothetical protein
MWPMCSTHVHTAVPLQQCWRTQLHAIRAIAVTAQMQHTHEPLNDTHHCGTGFNMLVVHKCLPKSSSAGHASR